MKFNHNLLFLFGFFYYLLIPFFIGSIGYLSDMPGMDNWYADYTRISVEKFQIYFAYISYVFFMFYIGSFLFSKVSFKMKKINSLTYPGEKIGGLFSVMLFLFLLYVFIVNYSIMFSGYDSYDDKLLGMIGTLSVLVLFFCVYALLNRMCNSIFFIFLMLSLVLSSIFLLGLGSRMYVLIPIIAFIIYKVNYSDKPISILRLFLFVTASLLGMLSVGVWRVGLDFNYDFFVYIFLAEPIFTSWSAVTFLQLNDLPIVAEPYNYASSFLNFIPSVIFPDKGDYIYTLSSFYSYNAPLGADNIFVSTVGNFGLLLGGVYFLMLGGFLSFLKNISTGDRFFTAYYICVISLVPFQLFRDNFSILNKQFYWNMFFIPLVSLFLLCLLRKFLIATYSRKHHI